MPKAKPRTVELGAKVKDRVTGAVGIATSLHYSLGGSKQWGMEREIDSKGEYRKVFKHDDIRVVYVGPGLTKDVVPASSDFTSGEEVEDMVTKLKGIVIEVHIFMNGCVFLTVSAPVTKDGKIQDDLFGPQTRFSRVGAGLSKSVSAVKGTPGGPSTEVRR